MGRQRDRTILDGFFQPRDAEDVRLACRALLGGSTQGSWGEVTSPELMAFHSGRARAANGGLACERIFGPLVDERCLCGKYQDAAARGTLCEKCGVLCDSSSLRAVRWGHVVLAGPLRHPIGVDVELVPVLPPGDRPLDASDDPARPARAPGHVNEAYRRLILRCIRWRRLVELEAPEIILDNEVRGAQRALDRLYAVVRQPPPPATQGWAEPDLELERDPDDESAPSVKLLSMPIGPPPPTDESDTADDDRRAALLWIDGERLAVQRASELVLIDAGDGAVQARHDVGAAELLATDGERLAVTTGQPYPDYGEGEQPRLSGLHVLELATGRWLDRYPDELPSVFWTPDQPEDAALTDLRQGRAVALDVPSDRPGVFAWTGDHRFVWVGGDGELDGIVVGADDALVYLETGALGFESERGPFLLADGRLIDALPDEGDVEADEDADTWMSAAAIALTPSRRWRLLAPSRGAGELDGQRFTLGFRARAAAFDATGDRLALLTGDAILVVAWEGPRLLARLPLRDAAE